MQNPIRIFLIDDSPHFLVAAQGFLKLQESFAITGTATDGQDALAQAIKLPPDVILLDLNLGEHSGLELIPSLKKHMPKTKIIVLTIMEFDGYHTAAMQAGADAFVRKTDMSKVLLPTIFEVMGQPGKANGPI